MSTRSVSAGQNDAERFIPFLKDWQSFNCWSLRDGLGEGATVPEIMDFVDSILELADDDSLSVARIGDGEFGLASGVTVPNNGCQAADGGLKEALLRVLRCDNPKCRVAIPKSFFYSEPMSVPQSIDDFVRDAFGPQYKSGDYGQYIVPGYKYMDASMSVVCKHYPQLGRRVYVAYYSLVKKLLAGRDVIVLTGDSRFFEYEKRLLDDAGVKSVLPLLTPQQNAWQYYDAMKKRLLGLNGSGDRLVLMACGPTATVLAYELADKMRCLDIGHMFGDYNLALGGADIGAFWA